MVAVFPPVTKLRVRIAALLPPVAKLRLRIAVFPPVVIVVVCFAARTFAFEPARSFPGAAVASDPVKINPVTTLNRMRFVFISLFLILKIRREKQARVSLFLQKNSRSCSPLDAERNYSAPSCL
jgi:hypothetical protein